MPKHNWVKIEVGERPTAWDWQANPEFVGAFIGVQAEVGPNKSNLYTFENEGDNKQYVIWGNTVLDNRFSTLVTGQVIKIVYLGEAQSPKGNTYHNFDVFKDEV